MAMRPPRDAPAAGRVPPAPVGRPAGSAQGPGTGGELESFGDQARRLQLRDHICTSCRTRASWPSSAGRRRRCRRACRGNGREAAIRRNRTYQKWSSPHGKGPHRLDVCRVTDVKVREQLILLLEEDSADSSASSGSGAGDFPEGAEPVVLVHGHPGKHSLAASSAQELPRPKLKAEISVDRSRVCCALSQLPSRYPLKRP